MRLKWGMFRQLTQKDIMIWTPAKRLSDSVRETWSTDNTDKWKQVMMKRIIRTRLSLTCVWLSLDFLSLNHLLGFLLNSLSLHSLLLSLDFVFLFILSLCDRCILLLSLTENKLDWNMATNAGEIGKSSWFLFCKEKFKLIHCLFFIQQPFWVSQTRLVWQSLQSYWIQLDWNW